jgi:hypothetical protein
MSIARPGPLNELQSLSQNPALLQRFRLRDEMVQTLIEKFRISTLFAWR